MEHYVTLFDHLFLPQGLALHLSMKRYMRDFTLWILCVDDVAYSILEQLNLPNVRLLKLSEIETTDLLLVKSERTVAEYCWTLTPFAPRFVFEADVSVQRVTYIDADLWFRKHPKPIYDELDASGKQVLITDHAYAPEYDQTATSGQYCVQFMVFTRDGGEIVRKWWEDRCMEWCFARLEDGKFGDQKYLDDWPNRFGSLVHVLKNHELTLAPWNASRFPYGNAIFYHFHGLRLISKNRIKIGNYFLPSVLRTNVYQPYYLDLRNALIRLEHVGIKMVPQAKSVSYTRRYYRKLKRLATQIRLYYFENEQLF